MPDSNWIIYLKKSAHTLLKHPNPKTLYSILHYYKSWKSHLKKGRNSLDDHTPWIAFSAIDYLEKIVRRDMTVFEYGSGGSTIFWAAKAGSVISVEHDPDWFQKMNMYLNKQDQPNVENVLAEPEADPDFAGKDYKNPDDYISSDPAYKGKNFENYVKTIDRFPDRSFDIIVVDGRARPSCIQHSLPKLKKNGFLIIDNTERSYYTSPFTFGKNSWKISNFAGPVPYMHDFSETTILEKLI